MPISSQAARAKREAERATRPARKPDFDQGYTRLPNAAVWEGAPAHPPRPPKGKTRWAKTPCNTPWGMCLAVRRLEDGSFVVCIECLGVRTWRSWSQVERLVGVKRWLREGF